MPVLNILLLPDSVDIQQLSQHQLFSTIPRFHRDKLAYLIFIEQYIRSINRTNVKKNNNYTKLSSTMLQSAVREYNRYYDVLQTLGIMLQDNQYSETEHISMGYILNPDYKSDYVVEYKLTLLSIIKRMRELTHNANSEIKQYKYLTKWFNDKLQIDTKLANQFYLVYRDIMNGIFMKDWIESFGRIPTWDDYKKFRPSYNEVVYQQYKIYRISHGYYPISVDDTSHRLHTNLTSLKSELRNALTYADKQLVSLDLSNSQPYFSLVLFNVQFWLRPAIATNEFNEWIADRFPNRGTNSALGSLPKLNDTPFNRTTSLHIDNFSEIAKYLNNTTHASNKETTTNITPHTTTPLITPLITLVISQQYAELEDVILYCKLVANGSIYEYIRAEWIKAGLKPPATRSELKAAVFQALFTGNQFQGQKDAKPKRIFRKAFPNVTKLFEIIKKRKPEQLPILLQSIESHLFLDIIAYRIYKERPRLPIFTIHDSIVTTKGNEEYVKSVMLDELSRAIGFEPTIKTEDYTSDNLERIIAKRTIDLGELYNVLDVHSENTRT